MIRKGMQVHACIYVCEHMCMCIFEPHVLHAVANIYLYMKDKDQDDRQRYGSVCMYICV
jgi:hypothetical protein